MDDFLADGSWRKAWAAFPGFGTAWLFVAMMNRKWCAGGREEIVAFCLNNGLDERIMAATGWDQRGVLRLLLACMRADVYDHCLPFLGALDQTDPLVATVVAAACCTSPRCLIHFEEAFVRKLGEQRPGGDAALEELLSDPECIGILTASLPPAVEDALVAFALRGGRLRILSLLAQRYSTANAIRARLPLATLPTEGSFADRVASVRLICALLYDASPAPPLMAMNGEDVEAAERAIQAMFADHDSVVHRLCAFAAGSVESASRP